MDLLHCRKFTLNMANLFRYLAYGYAPDVYKEYLNYDSHKPYTKSKITQAINYLINTKHAGKNFKIGKTGGAGLRTDQVDYRCADYEHMYLLYQHTNPKVIGELEEYYIRMFKEKYKRRCDNKQMHSGGVMVSQTAYYYLYLVI